MSIDEGVYLHQPRTVCFPHVITYSLFWFFPGITSNLMLVSPIPWFLQERPNSIFYKHSCNLVLCCTWQQWKIELCKGPPAHQQQQVPQGHHDLSILNIFYNTAIL